MYALHRVKLSSLKQPQRSVSTYTWNYNTHLRRLGSAFQKPYIKPGVAKVGTKVQSCRLLASQLQVA